MTPFDALKAQLSAVVPFAAYVGVEITEISEGTATTILTQSQNTSNHIATMHAGALFTLAEAASGAAMAGMFLEHLAGLRPVAASSTIDYVKPARGRSRPMARSTGPNPRCSTRLIVRARCAFRSPCAWRMPMAARSRA